MPKQKSNSSRKGYKPPPPPALKRDPSLGEAEKVEIDELGAGSYSQRLRKALTIALDSGGGSGGMPVRVLIELIAQYASTTLPLRMTTVGGISGRNGQRDTRDDVHAVTDADAIALFHSPAQCAFWRKPKTTFTAACDYLLIVDSQHSTIRQMRLARPSFGIPPNQVTTIASRSRTAGQPNGICVSPTGKSFYYTEINPPRVVEHRELQTTGSEMLLGAGKTRKPHPAAAVHHPSGICCSRDGTTLFVCDLDSIKSVAVQYEVVTRANTPGYTIEHETTVLAGCGLPDSARAPDDRKSELVRPTAVVMDWSTPHPNYGLYMATGDGLKHYHSVTGLSTVKSTLTGPVSNVIVVEATKLLATYKDSLYIVDVTTGETSVVGVSDGSGFGSAFSRPIGLALVSSGDVSGTNAADDEPDYSAAASDQLYVVDCGAHTINFIFGSLLNARL